MRKIVGRLSWLAYRTHPEICFRVSRLASVATSCTLEDFKEANKLIRMTKHNRGVRIKICLEDIDPDTLQIVAFTDASFSRLNPEKDPPSIGGIFWIAAIDSACKTRHVDNMPCVERHL